ncbi:hypothetical protein QKU48_gp1192 [Fadolivirus algeromassiliense]|jgi:hypothetical protein|uniref:Uncharacterized protein n=1 Tax=Fadolivirus FV1/VV64 TaxID=3070911 RepID=A0A7D3UTW7_9VIRU|nr:hypothetical protein QKU48_gp1192 [Fadolivirus algeromassiliense]QKF94650.1 hypothetical protein Fadolivirus_1_1192 [Fadolivirus FV1/VV64]
MTQTYTYYKSTNFPNDLYPTQLLNEIKNVIATQVVSIDIVNDNVNINFISTIPDKSILDNVIASHIPSIVTYQTLYPDNYLLHVNNIGTEYSYFGVQANEIHISKDTTSEYSSLKEAILSNNQMNTIYIVHPGTYIEDNPIVLPNGCSLKSIGTAANTVIVAKNPSSDLITLGLNCRIFGITLTGAYGTGSRGIYFDGSQSGGYGRFSVVGETLITNCDILIEADGKNGPGILDTLFCDKLIMQANSRPLSKGVYCHSGGQFISISSYVSGVPGYFPIDKAYHCENSTSKMSLIAASAWFCTTGLYLNNSGICESSVLTVGASNIGVRIGPDGISKASINSLTIRNGITYDLDIQATISDLSIYSSYLDDSKINNPNNVNINIKYNTNQYDCYYQSILGSMQIGSMLRPSELAIGEGLHNTLNLEILTNDNLELGTWTSITNDALGNTSGFNLFSSNASDNCLYIGSDNNIYGIKIVISTPTLSTTSIDDIIWEYWNGSAWTEFKTMQTKSDSPYYTIGDSFISSSYNYNIRFGLSESTTFTTKTLNSKTKKWVRLRVINTLSSIPVGKYIKIHTNSTKTNIDGFNEYFGNGRIVKNLPIDYNTYTSNSSSSNQEVFIGKNISMAKINNKFASGSLTRLGFCMKLPNDIDTSFPIKLNIALVTDNIATGNIDWIVRYDITKSDDSVYLNSGDAPTNSPNVTVVEKITTIPANNNNKDIRETISLDINKILPYSSNNPRYILWIGLERDATISNTNDTYSGSASIIMINSEYVSWNCGGHLNGF